MDWRSEQFALLRDTVHRTVSASRYYAKSVGRLPLENWDDFARFPVLSRRELAEHLDKIRVPGVPIHFVNATSGTSFSPDSDEAPLLLFRAESERASYRYLMKDALQRGPDSSLTMRIITGEHGGDLGGGVSGIVTVALVREHHVRAIRKLLGTSFEWGGIRRQIRVIAGSCYVLKCLAVALLKLGMRPGEFDIDYVVSSGGHLTSRWQRIFRRLWRAPVLDVYGLSEVAGFHCTTCPRCGGFSPSRAALTEFLAMDNDEPAPSGLARIVATAFYPLAEVVPIIRYDTGDVAYRDPGRDAQCEFCFSFIGRRQDLACLEGARSGPCVVSPLALNDILDACPSVVRADETPLASSLGIRPDIGSPRFVIGPRASEGPHSKVQVLVERKAAAQDGTPREPEPDRWRRLSAAASRSIFPPEQRDSVSVEIRPVPPGALGDLKVLD